MERKTKNKWLLVCVMDDAGAMLRDGHLQMKMIHLRRAIPLLQLLKLLMKTKSTRKNLETLKNLFFKQQSTILRANRPVNF